MQKLFGRLYRFCGKGQIVPVIHSPYGTGIMGETRGNGFRMFFQYIAHPAWGKDRQARTVRDVVIGAQLVFDGMDTEHTEAVAVAQRGIVSDIACPKQLCACLVVVRFGDGDGSILDDCLHDALHQQVVHKGTFRYEVLLQQV